MILRDVRPHEKDEFNSVVGHPMQSWEWGEFKKATGTKVERVGFFEGGRLKRGAQATFHQAPVINQNVGYFPKGDMPDEDQIKALEQIGKKHNALFIKMEPNVAEQVGVPSAHDDIVRFLFDHNSQPGRPLFTRYTFKIDLTQSEEKLFSTLKSKTRYNVNLAVKKGVTVTEKTSQEGMEEYIQILEETTKRQGFYAHTPDYFRKIWQTMGSSGMVRIFAAEYQGVTLTSWVMLLFNDVLYYPYGASRRVHRDVMANNLMLWEMIKFGKDMGCHTFDLWGSLGPEPNKRHPWYGFHRFKEGYGGDLYEFLGTYDYVLNPPMYKLFTIGDNLRWKFLRLKAKLPF